MVMLNKKYIIAGRVYTNLWSPIYQKVYDSLDYKTYWEVYFKLEGRIYPTVKQLNT